MTLTCKVLVDSSKMPLFLGISGWLGSSKALAHVSGPEGRLRTNIHRWPRIFQKAKFFSKRTYSLQLVNNTFYFIGRVQEVVVISNLEVIENSYSST